MLLISSFKKSFLYYSFAGILSCLSLQAAQNAPFYDSGNLSEMQQESVQLPYLATTCNALQQLLKESFLLDIEIKLSFSYEDSTHFQKRAFNLLAQALDASCLKFFHHSRRDIINLWRMQLRRSSETPNLSYMRSFDRDQELDNLLRLLEELRTNNQELWYQLSEPSVIHCACAVTFFNRLLHDQTFDTSTSFATQAVSILLGTEEASKMIARVLPSAGDELSNLFEALDLRTDSALGRIERLKALGWEQEVENVMTQMHYISFSGTSFDVPNREDTAGQEMHENE